MGFKAKVSTGGGTSDGRFIAPLGAEIIELGLCNQTIHQINECVAIEDLEKLTDIYEHLLENLFLT
jgi:succinyl-diaminopimelate desuccinylase